MSCRQRTHGMTAVLIIQPNTVQRSVCMLQNKDTGHPASYRTFYHMEQFLLVKVHTKWIDENFGTNIP